MSVLPRKTSWSRPTLYVFIFGRSVACTAAGAFPMFGTAMTCGRLERWPSYVEKKKARVLTVGPPTCPPNWLMGRGGRLVAWPRRASLVIVMGSVAFSDSARSDLD